MSMEYIAAFHEAKFDEKFTQFNRLSEDEILEHPRYIGSGMHVHAMEVSLDGLRFALRIPREPEDSLEPMKNRIKALERGIDRPHLEQLHSHPEEGYTVATHLVEGDNFNDLTASTIVDLLDTSKLQQLTTLSDHIHETGISLDPNPRNLLYDTKGNIQAIDYRTHSVESPKERSRNEAIRDFTLYILGIFSSPANMTRKGLAPDTSLGLLDRMAGALKHRPQDTAYDQAKARIEYMNESYKDTLGRH